MQRYTVYFIWKLLYMFRVVPSSIIRSANNCIYSIWYLSHRYCYLPAIAVFCAPDDGWRYHPKHVEQFPDKIDCVKLHLVGYIYWNVLTMHGPMNFKFKFNHIRVKATQMLICYVIATSIIHLIFMLHKDCQLF